MGIIEAVKRLVQPKCMVCRQPVGKSGRCSDECERVNTELQTW